jgi:adenylate cyclase
LSQGQRRLAAVMFTDMVGYTALTQSDESRSMDVLERHNRLLRPFFPKHGGREVKALGDSFLVEFESALDALRCAVEIQSYLHDYNSSSSDEWKIKLRIGIHLGDVIHRDSDIFGDAVNISSRIEPLAEPEGVCISRQVYDQVRNKFELPLYSMGEKTLKNVEGSAEVYAVRMPWAPGPQWTPPGARRVAVLPFSNMSPDPADEYFADGLTDELISTVSRIEGTEVISRTSVMQYKKFPKPIREISRELDAGTVLEGSVRKAGNRLRVTVQMIDAERDRHLWAESYDRNLDDVFAIQSDIAERVASALKVRMAKEPKSSGETTDLEAYTMYLRALHIYHGGTEEGLDEAVALLESAVSKDRTFVKAYALLARIWRFLAHRGDYAAALAKAEGAAKSSLAFGPDIAEAHAAMAAVHLGLDRFKEAKEEVETAVNLNPNLAHAYHLLGEINGSYGRLEEAAADLRKASALDPLSPEHGIVLAFVLRTDGKPDEGLRVLDRLQQLYPHNAAIFDARGICYAEKKEFARAMAELDAGLKVAPGHPGLRADRGILYAIEGKRAEAEEVLRGLAPEGEGFNSLNATLYIRAVLGDVDEAFDALFKLADLHAWNFLLPSEHLMDGLRKDPRFDLFLKKVGLLE